MNKKMANSHKGEKWRNEIVSLITSLKNPTMLKFME